MPCYHPLKGWRSKTVEPSGKRKIIFNASEAWVDVPIIVPCGQCIGCRLERSRQWAVRCVHEASLYEANSFITLTYSDKHMPKNGSLSRGKRSHFQLFMKRLRKKNTGKKIRFFHCGEYGEKLGRPHYHAILFNHEFEDKVLHSEHNESKLYVSKDLEKIWGKGFCIIGDVTFESAAYVARYVVKKINGARAKAHYKERAQEYTTMSRRPGIGKKWFERYIRDIYPDDFVIMRGKKMRPPRYYDVMLERDYAEEYADIKRGRQIDNPVRDDDNTHARLAIREQVQLRKLEQLKRPYERESET